MSRGTGGWGPTPDSHAFPTRRYDLVKEFVIALGVVTVLSVVAALVFSSPDDPAISLQQWARQAPADVVATAAGELAGTTTSAGYGPPYNTAAEGQSLGPVNLQKLPGVTQPGRLREGPRPRPGADPHVGDPAAAAALRVWDSASADQQQAWATAYSDALAKAPDGDPAKVAAATTDRSRSSRRPSCVWPTAGRSRVCSRPGRASSVSTAPRHCSCSPTGRTSRTRHAPRTSAATSGAS